MLAPMAIDKETAERIEQLNFTLWEFCWARDLTSAHAFLAQL